MDSDDDEDESVVGKAEDEEAKEGDTHLSPDDIRRQGELAEGVRKIRVSREKPRKEAIQLDCDTNKLNS